MGHTFATEQDGQIPQLRHVERLKHLPLIACAISIQADRRVLVVVVLIRKRDARAHGNLGPDNAIPAVEALGEHVHGAALAVRDTLAPPQQLADDGLDGAAAHQREAVAAVGGDDVVFLGDGVLDAGGDGFLARREVAEAADLLFFVEAVGGHFHASNRTGL